MAKVRANQTPRVPAHISKQISHLLQLLESYNKKLPKDRQNQKDDYAFLKDFFIRFIDDQDTRSKEISSKAYQELEKVIGSNFSMTPLWILCIDGRVLTILMHGMSAPDNSLRVPAGSLRDFVRDTGGKLMLLKTSSFAELLKDAFLTQDYIAEIFDSHTGCAARRYEESTKGFTDLVDDGLYSDVLYKKEMALATEKYVDEQFHEKKTVVTVQTSFDTHTGFMYMGFETEYCLEYARKAADQDFPVFSFEVITALVEKKKLFSTEEFVNNPIVREQFEKYEFQLNWKHAYLKSGQNFWSAVRTMKPILFPMITKVLVHVYPNLKKDSREMELRAMLLLTNAFSGYLNNQTSSEAMYMGPLDFHRYPYGVNMEECVKISEGGYSPYEISSASVYSGQAKNHLPSRVEYGSAQVRANRGRSEFPIVDRSKTFSDRDDFVRAPVPIIVQEIVHEEFDDAVWDRLSKIDWSDLPTNWSILEDLEFLEYLEEKGIDESGILLAINNLRKTMCVLYNFERRTSTQMIEQHLVILPYVTDSKRYSRFVVPFVKLGFI